MKNTFNPLVSIIIPVYNGENYLKEAIDSVLAQTYKNIEVIVVNDGSIDSTESIAAAYGNKIRYFTKKNGGVSTALNLAIKNARGQYISWLSHDDLYYPNKIQRQIKELAILKNKTRERTIVFSNFDVINVIEKTRYKGQKLKNFSQQEPGYTFTMLNTFFISVLHGCTLLIPTRLFDEISYFDLQYKTIQDYHLFIRFFREGVKYIYIEECLITARHHPDQDTLKLMPLHLKELDVLYKYAFDLFKAEFQQMPFSQFDHFLDIIKLRKLDAAYIHMMTEWANSSHNDNKVVIWLYWNNQKNIAIPEITRLCWKTIIIQNRQNFRIKILNDDNVEQYLPDIYQNVNTSNIIEYIRLKLLYKYGGIWLDNNIAVLRTLDDIAEKVQNYGMVCAGLNLNNPTSNTPYILPITNFMACAPQNDICGKIIKAIQSLVNNKIIIPDIDIKLAISKIINHPQQKLFIYEIHYFCPYPSKMFDPSITNKVDHSLLIQEYAPFAQILSNTVAINYTEHSLLNHAGLIGHILRSGCNIKSFTPEKLYKIMIFFFKLKIKNYIKIVLYAILSPAAAKFVWGKLSYLKRLFRRLI